MGLDIERRINRLLDQLGSPDLSDADVERIQNKIEYLRKLQQ